MYYCEVNGIEKEFDTEHELETYCDELDEKGLDFETFKDCETCDGQGSYDRLISCGVYPIGDCCGGCTEHFDCEECNDGKEPYLL